MKKNFFSKISVVFTVILTVCFSVGCFGNGCFGNGCSGKKTSSEPKKYTIQYTDDIGVHTLSVEHGELYSIESIPERFGYEFLGLYDAKNGGTQYVDETGSALSTFTDKKNIVLFPLFKAKEYTLVLDYQGAAVTGSRSMSVSYDSTINELPMNLSLEYKEFTGWYTEPNGQGIQIADEYGVLPQNNKIKETIFDLSGADNRIYLYAGFAGVKYNVTFYFDDNGTSEEMQIEHGTEIKDVVPETRVNGNAVLTWSKTKNDVNKQYVFNGKVTGEMILFATEYAPVIDFDENGGEEVIPVVARAGSSISLPTPIRENYKFIEWQDENGNTYTSTTMPTESVTLKAVWQAKLVFDENGGTEVTDISQAVGTNVTLPTPEKEGFIFAGWYTAEKERYTSTTMPAAGIALKAGWYGSKEQVVSFIKSTDVDSVTTSIFWGDETHKPSLEWLCYTFKYSDYFSTDKSSFVNLKGHIQIASGSSSITGYANFYSKKEISSAYLLHKQVFNNVTNEYRTYEFTVSFTVEDDFYICFYLSEEKNLYLSDFYFLVSVPDTRKLYL